MSMNPVSRTLSDEEKLLIDQYLKKGGKVTVGVSGQRTQDVGFKGGFYGKRKKQKEEKED